MNKARNKAFLFMLPLICVLLFTVFPGGIAVKHKNEVNAVNTVQNTDVTAALKAIWQESDFNFSFEESYDKWIKSDYVHLQEYEPADYSRYYDALAVTLLHYAATGDTAVPDGNYDNFMAAFRDSLDQRSLQDNYGIDVSAWEYRRINDIAEAIQFINFSSSGTENMMMEGETKYYIGSDNQYWKTIKQEMNSAGLEWNGIQCTSFARWRFYKYYGWGYESRGNGRDVAANLVKRYDQFSLESDIRNVKAGSIFSKTTGRAMCSYGTQRMFCGHVGFIEKIENGRVYYSDGNVTVNGTQHSIRFNESKSISEWTKWIGSGASYAVPKS